MTIRKIIAFTWIFFYVKKAPLFWISSALFAVRMEKKRRAKVDKLRRRGKLKENKFNFLSAFQAEIIRLAEEKTGQKLTGGPIVSPLPRSPPPEKPRVLLCPRRLKGGSGELVRTTEPREGTFLGPVSRAHFSIRIFQNFVHVLSQHDRTAVHGRQPGEPFRQV